MPYVAEKDLDQLEAVCLRAEKEIDRLREENEALKNKATPRHSVAVHQNFQILCTCGHLFEGSALRWGPTAIEFMSEHMRAMN